MDGRRCRAAAVASTSRVDNKRRALDWTRRTRRAWSRRAWRTGDIATLTAGLAVRYWDTRRGAFRVGRRAVTLTRLIVAPPEYSRPWLGPTGSASESSCVEWARRSSKTAGRSIHQSLSNCKRTALTSVRTGGWAAGKTWPWRVRTFAARIECSPEDMAHPSSAADCAPSIGSPCSMDPCTLAPAPRLPSASWFERSSSRDYSSSLDSRRLLLPTLKRGAARAHSRTTSGKRDLLDRYRPGRRGYIRACRIPCPSADSAACPSSIAERCRATLSAAPARVIYHFHCCDFCQRHLFQHSCDYYSCDPHYCCCCCAHWPATHGCCYATTLVNYLYPSLRLIYYFHHSGSRRHYSFSIMADEHHRRSSYSTH